MEEVPLTISINWSVSPWVITVPKADLSLDSGTKYNLTVDDYWGLLRDFADSAEAIPYPFLFTRIAATASTPSITDLDLNFYRIQFEDGLYSVNIINGNTNIRDAEVKNQVSVNTNNTTGFIDQSILVFSTFNSGIYWDAVSGKTSITDSNTDGNEANPLKNLADVQTQAVAKGFKTIYVVDDVTLGATDNVNTYTLIGINSLQTKLTSVSGATTGDTEFKDLELVDDLSGALYIQDCHLNGVTGIGCTTAESAIKNCILDEGIIQIRGDNTRKIHILNCASSGAGVILDINGSTGNIHIHHYLGLLKITNMTNSNLINFDSPGGELTIDSTCTAGTVNIKGTTTPVDNSGAGCTVNDKTTPTEVWNHVDGALLVGIIKNLKELKKIASSWYLIVYGVGEVSGGSEILRKKLTDSTGADITDLAAGTLAVELENTV